MCKEITLLLFTLIYTQNLTYLVSLPAFFLVATLAIMSALLLVGLILIAVRRNSRNRFIILDDKEELLPEEEQVSYEKIPKVVSN